MKALAILSFVLLPSLFSVRAAGEPPADLAAMLAEVEAANPEVLGAEARVRAAAEIPGQLEALPDPKLSVSYTNDGLSGFTLGSSEFTNLTVGWEQEVPYKAVRGKAADVARAEAGVVRSSAGTLRARLRARVVSLYADLYRIDRTAEMLAGSREVLVAETESARARYESGQGMQEGLLRAQTEIHRLDLEAESLRRERRSTEVALGETLGRGEDAPIGPATSLPEAAGGADLEALASTAAAGSPEVREAEAQTLRAEATLDNARVQTKPEFSWLAAYQFRGGLDPMIMGGFGVRLPVWKDRKQARSIVQSELELESTRRDRDRAALRARAEALDLASEAASADRSLKLYREGILPQDAATLDAARAAFSAGKAEMNLVLEDFRRWLTDRKDAIALETRRVQILAALESITGASLLDVSGSGRAQ